MLYKRLESVFKDTMKLNRIKTQELAQYLYTKAQQISLKQQKPQWNFKSSLNSTTLEQKHVPRQPNH